MIVVVTVYVCCVCMWLLELSDECGVCGVVVMFGILYSFIVLFSIFPKQW